MQNTCNICTFARCYSEICGSPQRTLTFQCRSHCNLPVWPVWTSPVFWGCLHCCCSIKSYMQLQGVDGAKLELQEVVDFLKNPDKYTALGAKIPKVCASIPHRRCKCKPKMSRAALSP